MRLSCALASLLAVHPQNVIYPLNRSFNRGHLSYRHTSIGLSMDKPRMTCFTFWSLLHCKYFHNQSLQK